MSHVYSSRVDDLEPRGSLMLDLEQKTDFINFSSSGTGISSTGSNELSVGSVSSVSQNVTSPIQVVAGVAIVRERGVYELAVTTSCHCPQSPTVPTALSRASATLGLTLGGASTKSMKSRISTPIGNSSTYYDISYTLNTVLYVDVESVPASVHINLDVTDLNAATVDYYMCGVLRRCYL